MRFFRFLAAGLLAGAPLFAGHAQQRPAMMTQQEVQALSTGYYNMYEYKNAVTKAALTRQQAYFTPDWLPGTLWTISGERRPVAALRYNMALRLVEVRDMSTPTGISVVPVGGLRGFTLGEEGKSGSHTFETRQVSRAANSRAFFEVLNPGPLQLLLQYSVSQKDAEQIEAFNMETHAASVGRITQLFVARPGQELVEELPLRRKVVEKLFGAQAAQVAAYAAEKNLNYEQVADIVWMANYYNSLLPATR